MTRPFDDPWSLAAGFVIGVAMAALTEDFAYGLAAIVLAVYGIQAVMAWRRVRDDYRPLDRPASGASQRCDLLSEDM